MNIDILLERVVKQRASDGFVSAGAAPSIKVDGQLQAITDKILSDEDAKAMVLSVMREDQQKEFLEHHECNFAITRGDLGRFRVSAFVQRERCGMVLRRIEAEIPTIESLDLQIGRAHV